LGETGAIALALLGLMAGWQTQNNAKYRKFLKMIYQTKYLNFCGV